MGGLSSSSFSASSMASSSVEGRVLRPVFTLAFFFLLTSGSHGSLPPPLVYWNSVLPNTPMPGAIRDLLLHPRASEDQKRAAAVSVGWGGIHVAAGRPGLRGGTTVDVGKGRGVGVNVGGSRGTHVGVGGGGVGVNVGGGYGGGTHVGVGGGGVYVGVPPGKGKPVIVHVGSPFNYLYAASETQAHDDPRVALFFLEKDILRPGTNMTLHFTPTTTPTALLLPREAAAAIPFSTGALPEILSRFSIRPASPEAETVAAALRDCEAPAMAGEIKTCATSLESMVDFATASLGTSDVLALSTQVDSSTPPKPHTYTVGAARRVDGGGAKVVACHAVEYEYAVFLCHASRGSTRVYTVPMVAEEGKVEAVAVCHTDTRGWNPKHLAFQVLKVRPGAAPVCHFLPQDHVVWTPKK